MTIDIREVGYEEICHLRKAAAADEVTIASSDTTRWFAAYWRGSECQHGNGMIVGIAALKYMRGGRARLKGLWVSPPWRRQGIAAALTQRRVDECRGKAAVVDTYAYHPHHYTARGFKSVGKKTSAGATKMALVLARRATVVKR